MLIGLALLVLLLFAIIWVQRRQIAADFIDRELAERGVRASYDVKRIGFSRQQLENLVIGDPADPDLTARSVEMRLRHTLLGPEISLVTARGVRLYGRVVDGKLTFGSIDRLLPPPSGKPFALPDLNVDVADAAIGLTTPLGRIGVGLEGKGNLADGFEGKAAVASSSLSVSGCVVDDPSAYLQVGIDDRRPSIKGPVRADRIDCEDADAELVRPNIILDADFAEDLRDWSGEAALSVARLRLGDKRASGLVGTLGFEGDGNLTRGGVTLAATEAELFGTGIGRATLDGRYAYAARDNQLSLVGDAGGETIVGGGALIQPIVSALSSAGGTPLEPIGDALAGAVGRAARDVNATASIRLVNGRSGGAVRIERLNAISESGARLALGGAGDGLTYYWPQGAARLDGNVELSGGGLPTVRASLNQAGAGAPIRGIAQVAPMKAGNASLRLAPIRFTSGEAGATRVETVALIDGPLNGGRVTGLAVPVSGRFGGGAFAFGEGCTPVSFRSLDIAGLRLGPTRLPLCPTGRALVWKTPGGGIQGGAEIRAPRLAGQLGGSPISLAADRVALGLADPGFTSANVAIRLGGGGSVHRLDLASLSGDFTSTGAVGAFSGGSAKIANVPLLLSGAGGKWSILGGNLTIDGAMTVADEADPARFYPLVTDDFHLTLIDSVVEADAWLTDPETGTRVTKVDITHSLDTGAGNAVLDVPGITFGPDYQPDELTRLTTGVVALVDGTVTGKGEIAWSAEGVTSTGSFSTTDMDLAATFGPVEGLTTTINFTDLLGLVSAPGQVAEVDLIRTGIDVFDGLVRYQLLPDLRVRVESGRWPFAGGVLILEETILDFSRPAPKTLTFRVVGLDAARFVEIMEFSNIAATGIFDGVVPMIFDESGGRIVGGRLEARPPGGTLSYVGAVSDQDLGAYGKLAFDALKSLRYDRFVIELDGSLDGEFLTQIELDGIATNTEPLGGIAGAIVGQLAKIPFEFNISIRGPFRSLIATARSLEDPSLLIQPVLPEILQDLPAETIVQPEESETVQ
ncbi:YdbH domain-containing protein [Enterovirga sp. GCM10030262]|uniref:intermembrane phospholipid transport protein YdbH family protein n=1 Tax=Enterovirga sp. GCM10030262 TaxID=3273391 RepID=UPI003620A494